MEPKDRLSRGQKGIKGQALWAAERTTQESRQRQKIDFHAFSRCTWQDVQVETSKVTPQETDSWNSISLAEQPLFLGYRRLHPASSECFASPSASCPQSVIRPDQVHTSKINRFAPQSSPDTRFGTECAPALTTFSRQLILKVGIAATAFLRVETCCTL